ncbi:MAG: hypothetical protein DHS20C18_39830 [Saprospiraceae bacterium]|nr:MAG: hypothetical protein DHS20C18_39830 [Saprospiraceae bacterium]
MATTSEIRELITKGKLKEAIEAMINLSGQGDDSDLQNSLILQSSRFQENERSNLSGIISSGDYSRSRSRITFALLSYLDELKDVPGVQNNARGAAQPANVPNADAQQDGTEGAESDIIKILFLASNPSGTAKLQLDKEHSKVSKKLQNSPTPGRFRLKLKEAVTLTEFLEYLIEERPEIIHFSGHGEKGNKEVRQMVSRGLDLGEDEVPEDDTGIILYDDSKREPFFVGTTVIRRMFKSMINVHQIPIKVVLFNNCFSQAQAEAVAEFVPNVIGTSWSVKDEAAIAFATSFYFGIANDKEVNAAVDLGITNALAYGEPEDRFVLYQEGKKVSF